MKQAMETIQDGENQKSFPKHGGSPTDNLQVAVNGQQKILSIKIAPEAMDPSHPEKLEKLLHKTIVSALEDSKKLANERLGEVTNGSNIPGLTS